MRRGVLVAVVVAVVVVGVVAAVLLLRSDDGSESLSAPEWADSVCTSLGDWRSSITALADASGETLTPELLREKLEAASAATDVLVSDLEGLGPPELEAGAEAKQALDDAAEGLRDSYSELEAAATDALETENRSEFIQGLAALAPKFQSLLDQIRDTVASLQSASLFGESSAELEQAFSESESCQALENEG
jgi:hypothetical protein